MIIRDRDYDYTKLRNRIFLVSLVIIALPVILNLILNKGFKVNTPRSLQTLLMMMYYVGVHLPFTVFKSLDLPVGTYGNWFSYALPNAFGYSLIALFDLIILYGLAVVITWEIKHMSVKGV